VPPAVENDSSARFSAGVGVLEIDRRLPRGSGNGWRRIVQVAGRE